MIYSFFLGFVVAVLIVVCCIEIDGRLVWDGFREKTRPKTMWVGDDLFIVDIGLHVASVKQVSCYWRWYTNDSKGQLECYAERFATNEAAKKFAEKCWKIAG